ncbi:PAS domain S-box protein [Polaromonas sp.]|uniref:PAS domain S-box protein n=1 Tax=Polaromonas sp. TaxID=1869339 RepID=UPI003C93386D
MTREEELLQANERLKAQLAELATAKERLALELTEQKREAEVLRSSVQGLRELATISADWYWEQDAEHRFVRFSGEQAAENLDTERDSHVGTRRWELPGVVPLSDTWEAHRAVLDAHQPFRNFEYMRTLGDDLPHYLSVSGIPVFDDQNRFLGYRGTVHDITEIKRSEEAQRKTSQFLDEVVGNIPIAVQLKSVLDGHRIALWNKAAETVYGLTRDEAMGHTVHDLWPKAVADRMHASDLEVVAEGVPQDFPDRTIPSRTHGTIRLHVRKVPLRNAVGEVSHILITSEDITERLEAEDRLRRSQERFRSLTQLSSDWYWELDDQFRFTRVSSGAARFGRLPAGAGDQARISEYIGKTRWEIDDTPGNKEAWALHRAQLEKHETFRDFEYERVDMDGRRIVFSISGEPVFDADGKFKGYRGVGTDITARLEAEASLRRSEERFRGLTGLSSDWYWEQDDQFRNVFVSKDTPQSGPANQSVGEGKRRWDLPGAAPLLGTWEEHKALLAAHLPFRNFEYQLTGDDGSVIYRSVSGEPVFDAGGSFTGYRGVGSDITSRKQTELALRTSEVRFRTVVSALAEGVVLRDAEGRIVDCNASAERILGKTLAQMEGQTVAGPEWEMLREDGSLMPEEEHPNAVARRTGLPQSNAVVCYRKPDGNILWALLNVQPLFNGSSRTPSGYVTTVTDISKRKRDEMEIVRLNVDLEKRVMRRTAQLEAANTELEAFSYSVAHDLRSPLSTIDGYCALLQKAVPTEAGERVHHYVDRIRGGVRRMGELTDGLLSLAKLSRTSLNWEAVDLSVEAARVLAQLSENEPGRDVRATVEPGLMANADAALLRQVLENLLGNAWKFTARKTTTEIMIGKEDGADLQPVYFVKDNGAGFDMAYVDKLFGTFQRLHSSEEFAGSGIGLATVKRIITRHGGRIWASSVPNEGSTFYFTLGGDQGIAGQEDDAADNDSGIALALSRPRDLLRGAGSPASSDNDNLVSDQLFTSAFEHSSIGMALVGIDSNRLRVNSAFCQMLGYSEAEMLARSVKDITHPDDVEWDLLQRKRALAGEIETYQWEKRYIHKSGRIVWGFLSCSLVRDADRKPLHFISQIQDITERKESERVLQESEERFRMLTQLSSDWFWEQDENFRFVEIKGKHKSVSASSNPQASIFGKTPWELDSGMDPAILAEHKAIHERHEAFRNFEFARRGANGAKRYMSVSGAPIFDAAGRFTGYRSVGRDITEIRRVGEALRASERQLREITDTVPALIAYVDKEQCFRFHNRAYEEAFGLSYEQFDGKHLREVMGDEFYEVVRPRVEEVLTGYPVAYERTQTTARGDQRDYVVNYFPRYGDGNEEGEVIGFYSLATDVTELKRIDRMKSEFVSTVSHELRTPLTSIRGSLGLISGGVAGQLPDAVKTLVGIAKNNCERLIRLINDILDIEKIESGKMRLDLQVVELKPLLVQTLAANEGFGTAQNVSLSLDFPEDGLQVHVDSDRLAQVMTNLLSNAMKFSPPGGVVEVRVSQVGMGVRVEVRDHGPGIPEEFRKRIFQKFSQADSSDTRQKGGTGLGLNISRAIIERLGGSIGFESAAGVGTTFFFELPLWTEPVQSLPPAARDSNRPRILICEDDRDIARLIAMMLDKGGFDSDMVYRGADALACLAHTQYAAMTLDLRLPDQDGITLIRTLRSQEGTRELPIVVVSAMAGEGQIQFNNHPETVSEWLEKPIDENLLILGLRRAIKGMAEGKPRILHVEDDLDIQRIAAAIMQEFATFEFAATLQEARACLAAQAFDLVLLDLTLPGGSGWDLLSDIEALDQPPPVVVFSAREINQAEKSRAAAVLIKAQTSNEELLKTLQQVLAQRR